MGVTMTTSREQSNSVSASPDQRMEFELEADPILRFNEGRANWFKIGIVILICIAVVGVVLWAIS